MNRKWIAATALAAALMCFLTGCKKGEDATELPTEYTIGEETVTALTMEPVEVTEETSEEGETTYIYTGLPAPGDAAANYTEQLTAEESGFSVVDEEYVLQTDEPDFTTPEGTVRLAKSAAEEGKLLSIQLTWAEEQCTVTASSQEGSISAPPQPQTQTQSQGMSLMEAVDYLESLEPSSLGLSGDSMSQFQIYAVDGVVFVDENPCLRLTVYDANNPEQTNDLLGSYLITGDKAHLYRLDTVTQTVEELVR